jgi:hypothetical protein
MIILNCVRRQADFLGSIGTWPNPLFDVPNRKIVYPRSPKKERHIPRKRGPAPQPTANRVRIPGRARR